MKDVHKLQGTSASLDFSILRGFWNQFPMDSEGWLYYIQSDYLAFFSNLNGF